MDRKGKRMLDSYQPQQRLAGVVRIRNERNGKVFLVGCPDLHGRADKYRIQLIGGMHPNRELQQDFKELGADAFTIEVIEQFTVSDELSEKDVLNELAALEEMMVEEYEPFDDKGYNKRGRPIRGV